jgi:hypothetical protein
LYAHVKRVESRSVESPSDAVAGFSSSTSSTPRRRDDGCVGRRDTLERATRSSEARATDDDDRPTRLFDLRRTDGVRDERRASSPERGVKKG